MNRSQQSLADRSLRQRQQYGLIRRRRGSLRCGIKLANGFDLVAKQLYADLSIRLRRINVENPAAQSLFPRDFDNVGGVISYTIKILPQSFTFSHLTPA